MSSLIRYFNVFFAYSRKYGFLEAIKKVYQKLAQLDFNKSYISHSGIYNPPELDRFLCKITKKKLVKNIESHTVVWIMPTFNKGSGGHTTIFRFAKFLEIAGFKNLFVIRNGSENSDPKLRSRQGLLDELRESFYTPINLEIKVFDNNHKLLDSVNQLKGDVVIGTDIFSQLITLNCSNFNDRWFFLQDHEALFKPASTLSIFADMLLQDKENKFICAGEWLKSLTDNQKSISFKLGVDSLKASLYSQFTPHSSKNNIKIAAYSRFTSPRRAVDHIWSILTHLEKYKIKFEVHAFGNDIRQTKFPFKVISHGVLSSREMYRVISQSDISIAFSATNYSLLPYEAVSLETISLDIDSSSNRKVYTDGSVMLLPPIVDVAAKKIKDVIDTLNSKKSQNSIKKHALFVRNNLNWTDQIYSTCKNVFDNFKIINKKISVCIPTLNAGNNFEKLLYSLQYQKFVDIELCIIDSGSHDKTLFLAEKYFPNVKIKSIKKSDFGHGKTRNDLARMASNKSVLFLTQDAIPMDDLLAISMHMQLQKNKKVVGVFSRHEAYPCHNPFIRDSISSQFDRIAKEFSDNNFSTNQNESKNKKFFSTNCCLVNKEVLLKYPFKDVSYGEDQLWMYDMLNMGYGSAYIDDVSVMHSHDYDSKELFNMTKTDIEYHAINFSDYRVMNLKEMDAHTRSLGATINTSNNEIETQLRKNKIIYSAYLESNNSTHVSYQK